MASSVAWIGLSKNVHVSRWKSAAAKTTMGSETGEMEWDFRGPEIPHHVRRVPGAVDSKDAFGGWEEFCEKRLLSALYVSGSREAATHPQESHDHATATL